MTTYTKKFKEFIPEWNPESDDYIVGYRNLDDSEIRIPLLAVDNSITANKYIRKDIDDYANGIIRFNKGFTVSNKVMSTIYLQGLDGWMGTQKGDFEMNSLILREFLEVPELRKNKITVMGNQFWFTDSAMVKVANATGSDNYDIYFKLEDEEYAPFELNDIIKGIYHYNNGFWTVYLKVYELIVNPDTGGEIGVKAHSMNGRDPRQSMLLARMNNSDNPERQGSIFADGLRKYIRVLDGYNQDDPTSEGSIKTLKVQIGDLSTITNHPIFGDLEGYGLYADNVYLTGKLIVKNDPNQPGQELGVYRGVWNNKAKYYKYDQVTYKGSLFTSKQIDNIGHIPTGSVDDLWWELTVAKGEDGTSAESNVIIELTNDNHNIPTDSEGKNPSYGGAYCTAYVFQGTNDITELYTISATVEAPVTSQQLQIVQNDNTVTITHISDDIDAAAIKFTATAVGHPTVTRTWNVAKVKSGTPGEPATAYWIVTDSPVIKKYVFNVNDSEVIRYEPSPFVVRAFAQTGQENIRPFDGYFRIKYGTQVNIIADSIYQFTPQADVDNYTIEFFLEQGLHTLLDKEIITVVEDGRDGDTPDWNIFIFKKGPEQPSAPTFTTPPSSYPSDGWYDYPTSDGIWWMSTAVVNGNSKTIASWSVPVKTTGEDGLNGVDGGYVDFKYAVSTSHNTPPSIVKTDRQPAGWSDVPPTVTSGLFLWMVNAFINPDNTLNGVWSDPMRISGETGPEGPSGPQGLHGDDGLQGPSIVFGGNWSDTTQYYGYADTQTCVYYGGKYYYTKTVFPDLSPLTIPSGAENNPASANGKVYWNEFVGQFDNIATGLLLAERIATSELTANKLFIVDRQESTGNIIAADGSIITKEEEKNLDPNLIIGRLTKGWYLDQGVIRSIAVNSDSTPKLILDKDGKITATGVNVTGTVHFENGTIGSLQVFNDSAWTATVNGPYPASSGYYYLRKNQGVTITPQGHIIGKDYFLTGDSTVGPSVFVGDVYVPGSSVPGTNDSTLTSFLKLFNSLFERVLINSQYHIKAKLPLFSVGEITAYGGDNMDAPSIWDSIPVDKVTIDLVNGKLTVIGGTGGIKGISLPSMTAEDALVGASLNTAGDVITFTKGTFATKAYVTWGNITNKPTILAGNGLTGGGLLNADRTLTLGTPSNITATSTNSVTASSHTHNLVMGTGSGLDADLLDGEDSSFFKKRYNAIIKKGVWSRILHASPNALSGSFMVSINYTRDSVVVGNVFLVTFGHAGHGQITVLGTHGYTQIQARLTGDDNTIYLELLDEGYGTVGGTQIATITLDAINANITTYTSFTDGTTLSGSVKSLVSTVNNRINVDGRTVSFIDDDISGNAATATKLQTPRTIAGVSFDGSANISIPFANLSSKPTTISDYGITDATPLPIFFTHNNDNTRHITGAERTKWNGVVTDFAGLEIGGRNLVKDSAKTIVSSTTYNLSKTSQQLKGKTITVSFEYEYENVSTGTEQNSQRFGFEWQLKNPNWDYYLNNWVFLPESSSGLNGSGRAIKTLTVLSDHTNMLSTAPIYIQVAGGTVRVWNFKIEEGNKATDWTPAPEDLEIGGRNLLRNSNVMLSANSYGIGLYAFSQKPVVGARYTLVICAKCGVNNTGISVYQDEGYYSIGSFTSQQESVQSFSFTYSSERNSSYMAFYQMPNGIFGGSYVKWAILVEGDVPPTSWTPAPEDQVSDWNTTDVNSFSFIKNKPKTVWGQSLNGGANISGNLTASNFMLSDLATNPYLRLTHNSVNWYIQAYKGYLYLGAGDNDNPMRIDSSGNVNVYNTLTSSGTVTAPNLSLGNNIQIRTNSGYLELVSVGSEICVGGSDSSNMHVNYRPANNGTPTNWYWRAGSSTSFANFYIGNLNATGNIIASGEVTAYSDIRLKSNIDTLPYRGRLSPKTYIKDGKQSIGFIAQEVQELYPELVLVGGDDNHYLSLNYGSITSVLSAQVNTIEDEVTILKNKIKDLEYEITILKNK